MKTEHLEILVEEPSMEAFLQTLLPQLIGHDASFYIYPYQGKEDLLGKLGARLKGYAGWLPETWRIVVVVDRDEDECTALKDQLEQTAATAGLSTRSSRGDERWQVVNRIAVEELEAWYFGDWEAVRRVYPRVSASAAHKEKYRNPDAIPGGTWEAFERLMQKAGYFRNGLRKIEVARALGPTMDPKRNRSHSFQVFRAAILDAMSA